MTDDLPRRIYPPEGDVYVSPRYLAGSNGIGDAGFAPVAHWPRHDFDDGPCQLLVSSPDGRIRIGWYGDDFELWKITACEDASGPTRWAANFNHVTPAELVAGLTTALAQDWVEGNDRFLESPSWHWRPKIQPLIDAGWTREPSRHGEIEFVAPDGNAGVSIDTLSQHPDEETVELWAGPPGWGTRAEARFTSSTPAHLIAATAAAFTDPAPVLRYREHLSPRLAALAHLTPVTPPKPPTPTPLDVQRTLRRPPMLTTRSVPRWNTSTPVPAAAAPTPARAVRR
ncbi:DUF317 domain-containing protein [Streptomyces sp. CC208A]|uniref:DUF317 domain-containing protein n=1 Tax=Streptomyces sp. CC208A TaxID=3044573 RepID=UPI0024A90261|nr:DUF317 domain-containing protein [Streptomyces sp. CC208A]